MLIGEKKIQTSLANPVLWGVFILYVIVLSFTIAHHELWGDEIHSWNIAKASTSFSDLISNTRYEGHPPLWYTILWSISKLTHNVDYIQLTQLIIASLVVFLVMFFSPFPLITRILIPFGYFFLFEYGVLSRNYAIGVLLAFCICIILHKNFKYKLPVYYVLLFLMSNTHPLGLHLACCLHLYFLLLNSEQKKKTSAIISHILLGAFVLLPSLYFIFPPPDSSLNIHFWMSRWNIKQLTALIQRLLYAFVPVPAWWKYNFWNTQFLLEAQRNYPILKFIKIIVLLSLFGMFFSILKKNKKSLIFFAANLFLSFIVSVFVPLVSARYSGFLFIGFIVAYWLYCSETPVSRNNKWLVNILLVIQLAGGAFAVVKDIQLPFSNGYRVKELLNQVPQDKKVVTDYWTLNVLTAFTDKPYYCLEMQKEMSFLLWNQELATMTRRPDPYSVGLKYLFQKEGIQQVYMISIHSPQDIPHIDSQLTKLYQVKLIDKREGAIEKGGNLYLYQISSD